MTVTQLIQVLNIIENPDDVKVMTRGYGGGYDDVSYNPTIVDMALNVNSEWYYGSHERVAPENGYKDKQIVKAIIL